MLARTFNIEEATSIWAELVEEQKKFLRSSLGESLYPEGNGWTQQVIVQEISRRDLSQWDASARAWLQSADQAKILPHKQMQIIINDIAIPVNNEPTVYRSVTAAWKGALIAVDNLLQGVPRKIQDGAALLAISAWHLYPDMVVYGGRDGKGIDIKMKDSLFEPTRALFVLHHR